MKKIMMFTASWCAPCKNMKPVVVELCSKHGVELELVDIEEQVDVAKKYGIRSVPTVMAFEGKFAKDMISGQLPTSDVTAFIEKHK